MTEPHVDPGTVLPPPHSWQRPAPPRRRLPPDDPRIAAVREAMAEVERAALRHAALEDELIASHHRMRAAWDKVCAAHRAALAGRAE